MGSSFLFLHIAPCTTMSCPCIGQTYRPLNSNSLSLFRFPRHLSTSGFEVSSLSIEGSGFLGDSSSALACRSPEFRISFRPSHSGLQFGNPLLRSNVGITDGTRGYVISTASTKEREWHDYEDELQDSAGVLEIVDVLKSFESVAGSLPAAGLTSSTSAPGSLKDVDTARSLICPQAVDDLKILDACQMASDLTQVAKAYEWLLSKGFMPNFGKDKVKAFEADRLVTEAILMDSLGLEASKLSPKKWGLSGKSAIALPLGIALFSYIRDSGIDVRPVAALILALGFYDAIYLGGTGLVQIFSMWLPYKRRVLVHEAGHVLVGMGYQFGNCVLSADALFLQLHVSACSYQYSLSSGLPYPWSNTGSRAGFENGDSRTVVSIFQAGTQFWDQTLEMEFLQEGPAGLTVDRYSIVLFAGIAAEALIYGEAQGGEGDENLFKSVVGQFQPSWSLAKMSDHARWAVLQAFELLRDHKKAHVAVVRALEQEDGLGSLIRAIEEAMA